MTTNVLRLVPFALALAGCPETRVPVPTADAGTDAGAPFDPGPSCATACAHLRALGCPEGDAARCEPTCAAAVGVVLPATWTTCVVRSSTRLALADCRVTCAR